MATLTRGLKGEAVSNLQRLLIKAGFSLPQFGADGDFGLETEKAVIAFKTKYSLPIPTNVITDSDLAKLTSIANGSNSGSTALKNALTPIKTSTTQVVSVPLSERIKNDKMLLAVSGGIVAVAIGFAIYAKKSGKKES